MADLSVEGAQQIIADKFAPWVQALGLSVEAADKDGVRLRLPFSDHLVRVGGVLSGQALMSAADTAMVIALAAAFGEFRPVATVGQTISLLRPAAGDDVLVDARVVRLGRTIGYCETWLRGARDARELAHATGTFALPA